MRNRLNIGVLGTGLIEWSGGVDLLRIVLGALNETSREREIQLTLFLPSVRGEVTWLTHLHRGVTALFTLNPVQRLREVYWQINKTYTNMTARDKILNVLAQSGARFTIRHYVRQDELKQLIKHHRIDALIPSLQNLGKDFPIPWVGYLADLQHKHLPELFSQEERAARDKLFSSILESAPAIVVTSQSVKQDIETFYPGCASQIFVWPFAPFPFDEWFDGHDVNISAKYNLPTRYFLISSQFWRHKSHVTAIEALARIRQQSHYGDVKLVCTGATDDYRHPGYFNELRHRIADLGLTEAVMILGHIPKRDQIEIMKNAVGLIQPTLFEGTQGGLAVYDAVGLGVRAIVSDIPVNLEIHDPLVTFFRTGSAEDLAHKLLSVLEEAPPHVDKQYQMQLARQRITSLGTQLIDAVNAAIRQDRTIGNNHLSP